MPKPGERVLMTLPFAGLRAMQVCVMKEVSDEEILEYCNRVNPQQTAGGWHTVVRDAEHARKCGVDESARAGQCVECPDRMHKIVLCL